MIIQGRSLSAPSGRGGRCDGKAARPTDRRAKQLRRRELLPRVQVSGKECPQYCSGEHEDACISAKEGLLFPTLGGVSAPITIYMYASSPRGQTCCGPGNLFKRKSKLCRVSTLRMNSIFSDFNYTISNRTITLRKGPRMRCGKMYI